MFKWNIAGLIKVGDGDGSEDPVVFLMTFYSRDSYMVEPGLHGSASPRGVSLQYFSPIIHVFKPFHLGVSVDFFKVL